MPRKILDQVAEEMVKAAAQNQVCGSCGAPVVWARTEDGEQIVLDDRPIERYVGKARVVGVTIVELVPTYVPHFNVCPKVHQPRKEPT